MASQTELVFEPFCLDAINERLLRNGKQIRLTPKAFSLLRYLADHSDQLVTKEALLNTLWPNIAVTDAVLTVCIGEIRKALGDISTKPKFIETVHRRGYRFLAPQFAMAFIARGNDNAEHSLLQHCRWRANRLFDDGRWSTHRHSPAACNAPRSRFGRGTPRRSL